MLLYFILHMSELSRSDLSSINMNDIILDVLQVTITRLAKKELTNEDLQKLYSIELNEQTIDVLNRMMNHMPEKMNDIENLGRAIIKDNKIDIHDVPNLIVVVKRIYGGIQSMKNVKLDTKKKAVITASIIKFVLHVLIRENIIKVNEEKQQEFLIRTDELVDSCASLISFPDFIKPKNCIDKLFRR